MDYEKKYNEALERAKYYHDRDNIQFLENIFPELKESEDEKIRKSLIDMLKNDEKCYLKEIAWLERQGTPAKLSEEEQNKFAKGVLTSCAMSFIDYLDAHKHEGKMCVSNGECEDIENAFHNAMWDRLHRYYCKYIEKQGEKKPLKVDFHDLLMDVKFGIDPSPKQGEKKSFGYENANMQQNDFAPKSAMEATKEEKADNANKAELKYHKGDWVVTDKCDTVQIRAVNNGYYTLYNGMIFNMSYVDKCWHRWTIADAKPGDVLATKDSVFIFKHIDKTGLSLCKSYCEVIGNSELGLGFDFSINGVTPATKEQRDLLSQKMSDAGYAFDFDKKELMKIEDRLITGVEIPFGAKDSELEEVFYSIPNGFHAEIEDDKVVIKKGEQKPWSEEVEAAISLLKHIAEEQEKDYCPHNANDLRKAAQYLETCRPQSTWKPSDEQIGALEHFVRNITESGFASPYDSNTKLVYSLFNDLKKLEEE